MRNHRAAKKVYHGHVTAEQAAEILRLYQDEKLKMVAVAERMGLTEWCVWKTLHREGAQLRPKGRLKGSGNGRPLVWLDKARRLYESGKSLTEVADALGIGLHKVRYHFQKAGIPCRKQGRPRGGTVRPEDSAAGKGARQKDKRP